MNLFRINSFKDLLVHLLLITLLGVSLVLGFFNIYLPIITNHGETITVPDVRGVSADDLDDFLESRDLRYEVTADSGYSASLPPLAVLKQFPLPNAKVKGNRKVYVTLNAENPPLVRMPKLVGGSVKNAQLVLKTYDLALGEIEYVPDLALNYILEQLIDGQPIEEGERIAKGTKINLKVGDGLGKQSLEAPNLIGLDIESAQFAIVGSGLRVGNITATNDNTATILEEQGNATIEVIIDISPKSVVKQKPRIGENMRLGQIVDLWIYSPDSLNSAPTILDN
ncbi:MAG: beta-lactam-binding protein with PASTA domain [Cyclobacteriaceae bacterium]|jgi:beta-lactam-binding protein with PASTA domain